MLYPLAVMSLFEAWVEKMVQAIRKHDRDGLVTVDGKTRRASYSLQVGDEVACVPRPKEAAANLLTHDALDPVGKIPEFKFCAVRVRKNTF